MLKYTLSPLLCWSTLYHRCGVEARHALCCRYGRGTQADKRQRAGRATDRRQGTDVFPAPSPWPVSLICLLLLLPDQSPAPSPWPVSLICLLLLLPDMSPWPVSLTCLLILLPDENAYRKFVNLKNKKSMGPDNINSFLLKLALPYVVDSLTHV